LLQSHLGLIGALERLIKPGARVLIKPNVGVAADRDSGQNTDPRLLEAVILLIKDLEPGEIMIGESSVIGLDTCDAFKASGIFEVSKRTNTKLIDFKKEKFQERKLEDPLVLDRLKVPQLLNEVDVLINLAKLKTIASTVVSLGMKNLKGMIPDTEKRQFHYTHLHKAIVDLHTIIKPDLTIVDGIIASEMYEPRESNVIIMGYDCLAVDTVSCNIMGIDPGEVDYLSMAAKKKLGTGNIYNIDIKGCELNSVRSSFFAAHSTVEAFSYMFPQVKIVEGGACTSCITSLYRSLKQAEEKGLMGKIDHWTIAVGKNAKINTDDHHTLFLGNCLKNYKNFNHYIPGCPFTSIDFVDLIKDL